MFGSFNEFAEQPDAVTKYRQQYLQVLKSVCEDTPRPVRATRPDLPEGLCDLIGKLLAKDPRNRFRSAREVAELLTGQLARAQRSLAPPSPSWRAPLLVACLVAPTPRLIQAMDGGRVSISAAALLAGADPDEQDRKSEKRFPVILKTPFGKRILDKSPR
jgi:hypothetical protein